MSIIRSPRPERGFTIVSNAVAQDERLSMRALGLLVRLLSRPDNWETNSATLAREFNVGREQMQGVLRELSEHGYMRLVKHRMDDGTFNSRWHVYDEPKTTQPEHGKPAPENPYSGEPVAFKKNLVKKETIQIKEEAPRKRDAVPACPPDVDQQTWADWLKLRKTKKAPVTETVIRSAIAESEKAGMTLEQFLQVWCARGSQGLEASWLNNGRRESASGTRNMETFSERDERLAKEKWQRITGQVHPDLAGGLPQHLDFIEAEPFLRISE